MKTTIDQALEFVAKAHEKQWRKGTEIPYISHPVAVGMLLDKTGCREPVVIAGLLHDTVEDTMVELEDIERIFGTEIRRLVEKVTEKDKSLPWETRKQQTIDKLAEAEEEVVQLTLADKIHNLRTLAEDIKNVGESIWSRFNRGKEKQRWYYQSILEAVESRELSVKGKVLFEEYKKLVNMIFG